ncbi:MAG: A24 family peptidase [Eubacteriales bacterium]
MGIRTKKIKFEYWGWILPICVFLLQQPDIPSFFRGTGLIVFGYFVALEDLKTMTIKNEVLIKMLVCWCFVLAIQISFSPEDGLFLLFQGILGFLIAGGVFMSVYIMSRKGLGGGDVKFMAVAGLFLGASNVFTAMIIGTTLSALFCTILIIAKKITVKTTLPLAPFLYLGILITIL